MTGSWLGYYKYDDVDFQKAMGFDKTYFTLNIHSFDGKNFKGTVNDDVGTGGMEETGEVIGEIVGEKISFRKFMPKLQFIYPNGERESSDKKHPTLYYTGILSNGRTEATGQWKFKIQIGFIFGFIPIPYRPGKGSWGMILQQQGADTEINFQTISGVASNLVMTYLTKIEDGKTQHFKATVEQNGVALVEGEFYTWLSKSWHGCGDGASAISKQKELVDEKLKDGFQITEFKETPENTIDVYDKAKWHYGGDFPADLDNFQGFVHTGMFLGWLIDNGLMNDEFKMDMEEEISSFKKHELTGSQIFENCCDGVLSIEELNELGNRFALHYFEFDTGQYLADYGETLSDSLPSMYHVADTWDNYEKLKLVIDKRFSDWRNSIQ